MKEQFLQELKEAMREKDEIRKNTITLLRSAILQVEKDTQKELGDDEIIGIVAKEVKKRKDAILDYEKAGRDDIISDLNKEIDILSKYLPKQLSKDNATSLRDMGKVMQELRPKTNGRADGKLVSEIVKEKLNNL